MSSIVCAKKTEIRECNDAEMLDEDVLPNVKTPDECFEACEAMTMEGCCHYNFLLQTYD
eukprot:UN13139